MELQELHRIYLETGSVWKTAEQVGLCGQSVHERLQKAGLIKKINYWTKESIEYLEENYQHYAETGTLNILSSKLGKHKTTVCSKAKELGLTNSKRKKPYRVKKIDSTVVRQLMKEWSKSELTLKDFSTSKGIGQNRLMLSFDSVDPDMYSKICEEKSMSGNSFYKKGRNFEYRIKEIFLKKNYIVIRSAQSKGIADLVAVKDGKVFFIQCKCSNWYNVKDWNIFYSESLRCGAVPLYATQEGRAAKIYLITDSKLTDGSKNKLPIEIFEP